jgi:hypothetical protein
VLLQEPTMKATALAVSTLVIALAGAAVSAAFAVEFVL